MKTILSSLSLLALVVFSARAQTTYTGTGDALGSSVNDGAGISSVVVNNTASDITFTINSTQAQASYIFYAIELQVIGQAANGDTGHLNPWGPEIGISTGENALINTYGTGATALTYSGGSWVAGPSVSYDAGGTGSTFATMTFSLSSLGLNVGDSFYFDVISGYTSQQNGYGQAAYGALDNTGYPAESDGLYQPWQPNGYASYYDSATATGTTFGTSATQYTVQPVPEPATCSLLGCAALFAVRRLFRRPL
ncbi:MAG TPA: hypothetical protein VFV81_02900 [Verrucomicrobiae bacterium]|nr:hypothetical protein [Verrucomicrobiae bacterium]